MAEQGKEEVRIGRPTDYTEELAERICFELAQGKSMRTVAAMDGMPSGPTMFAWLKRYPTFLNQYTRAKEEAADAFIEDMQAIADDVVAEKGHVAKARLQVETRKWIASKLKPKKYGERLQHANDPNDPMPAPIFGGMSASTDESSTGQ